MGNGFYEPLPGPPNIIGTPLQGSHSHEAIRSHGLSDVWESYNAIDWGAPSGSPLYAVDDGVISATEGYGPSSSSGFAAGQRLHLTTAGDDFYYGHMTSIVVPRGARVRAGQLIGYSGSANGVEHLHFAERDGDPLALVRGATQIPKGVGGAPPPPMAPESPGGTVAGATAGSTPTLTSPGGDPSTSQDGNGCPPGKRVILGGCHDPNARVGFAGLDPSIDCWPTDTWAECEAKHPPVRGAVGAISNVGDFLRLITSQAFWVRVGEIIAGVLLLWLALKRAIGAPGPGDVARGAVAAVGARR